MSKYHQSSNPFESDEDEGDFVVVGKTAGSKTNVAAPRTSQYSSSTNTSSSSYSTNSTNRPSNFPAPSAGHSYSQRQNQGYSGTQYYEDDSPFDDKRQQLLMKIANSENTQIESTQRALASIYESEAMGVATAEVCMLLYFSP